MPCLSRTELYKAIAVAILVLAISCLPYVLGYGFAPQGWDFGGFIINAEDSYIYLGTDYAGLGIYENLFLAGTLEPPAPASPGADSALPSVVNTAQLAAIPGRVLDIQGRDVSGCRRSLSPGIYFICPEPAAGLVRRVLVAR